MISVRRHRVWLDREINIRDTWTEPASKENTNKDLIDWLLLITWYYFSGKNCTLYAFFSKSVSHKSSLKCPIIRQRHKVIPAASKSVSLDIGKLPDINLFPLLFHPLSTLLTIPADCWLHDDLIFPPLFCFFLALFSTVEEDFEISVEEKASVQFVGCQRRSRFSRNDAVVPVARIVRTRRKRTRRNAVAEKNEESTGG